MSVLVIDIGTTGLRAAVQAPDGSLGDLVYRRLPPASPAPGLVEFDAAEMDGAGHWRALWLVVLPNLKPVLSALAIILFIDCWNEYFWPLLVTDAPESRTVQIGIREFLEADHNDFGGLMAGVTLASLPALAVFFLFQRKVMDTFVASGIK